MLSSDCTCKPTSAADKNDFKKVLGAFSGVYESGMVALVVSIPDV